MLTLFIYLVTTFIIILLELIYGGETLKYENMWTNFIKSMTEWNYTLLFANLYCLLFTVWTRV